MTLMTSTKTTTMMTVMIKMTMMIIRYYLGGRECIWTIQAEPGQRMELEVVDLALRDTGDDCEDSVELREQGLTLMSLCGDLQGRAKVIQSEIFFLDF